MPDARHSSVSATPKLPAGPAKALRTTVRLPPRPRFESTTGHPTSPTRPPNRPPDQSRSCEPWSPHPHGFGHCQDTCTDPCCKVRPRSPDTRSLIRLSTRRPYLRGPDDLRNGRSDTLWQTCPAVHNKCQTGISIAAVHAGNMLDPFRVVIQVSFRCHSLVTGCSRKARRCNALCCFCRTCVNFLSYADLGSIPPVSSTRYQRS
jgi:hypothetical protein